MNREELRATISVTMIYALRLIGIFLLLPIFTPYAWTLQRAWDGLTIQTSILVGLAFGIYGLVQAVLHIPFGLLSDRFGRKPLICLGLALYALGAVISAESLTLEFMILGRTLQGAGAISSVLMAALADLTRDEVRTRAMSVVGITIGLTFALGMMLGHPLMEFMGSMSRIFYLITSFCSLGILTVIFLMPSIKRVRFHSDTSLSPKSLPKILKDRNLWKLNLSIFFVHTIQMSMFSLLPQALNSGGFIVSSDQWEIYLVSILISIMVMMPVIIFAEKKKKLKPTLILAITLIAGVNLLVYMLFSGMFESITLLLLSLTLYFVCFNVLEAILPSMISRLSPLDAKGTAIGIYNTSQSLGVFFGSILAGGLSLKFGDSIQNIFLILSFLSLGWGLTLFNLKGNLNLSRRSFSLDEFKGNLDKLYSSIDHLKGVKDIAIIPEEKSLILRVDENFHEPDIKSLIKHNQKEPKSQQRAPLPGR